MRVEVPRIKLPLEALMMGSLAMRIGDADRVLVPSLVGRRVEIDAEGMDVEKMWLVG